MSEKRGKVVPMGGPNWVAADRGKLKLSHDAGVITVSTKLWCRRKAEMFNTES